jgi:hypothetical protein
METTLTEVITPERTRDGRGQRLYTDGRRDELIAAYQASGVRRDGVRPLIVDFVIEEEA